MAELWPPNPDDPEEYPPPEYPTPDPLPGLGRFGVNRFTSNIAFSEEIPVLDGIEIINTASQQILTQGYDGKIRLGHKKPADYALGLSAFASLDSEIDVDDVSAWIDDTSGFLLVGPHTVYSEIRTVDSAVYPTAQNSTTLTTSHTGTDFTVAGFAGAAGASTPATATITVNSFTALTTYTVTLDGYEIQFAPSSGDTEESIAAYIAFTMKGNPGIRRRFLIEWESGDEFVTITAKFGTLTLGSILSYSHIGPVVDPTTLGSLTATAAVTDLAAGVYRVAYSEANDRGETLLSPYKTVTLAAGDRIDVPAVTPSVVGNTIRWYASPEADSTTAIRFYLENDGSAHSITTLPLLSAALPPDLNRTGTEVMRVRAVFSDRSEERSAISRSNILKDSIEWHAGSRKKTVNQIELKCRDAADDWRLLTIKVRDDASIARTRKTSKEEINGQAIDSRFQGYRIARNLLADFRDADFRYRWSATREALLLEEADVVCITDDGTGAYNLPVWIEEISFDIKGGGLPKVGFTASIYASTRFDDSLVDRALGLVAEPSVIAFE